MAAAVELVTPKLRDLAGVTVEKLAPLLEEEIAVWRRVLDWDFQAPAGLVRRYLESGALTGYVLEADQRLVGYAYFVAEPPKCLLGDLFLSEGLSLIHI